MPALEVEPAGRFRIYLGAAAGVGKTYAMLGEGQRRRSRGADVVVGFVECHGLRTPNGCSRAWRCSGPHEKRWQDVLDILAAGIDLITTVNIQHLESIADETDDDLLAHQRPPQSAGAWETAERIMVAVTTAPGHDGLLLRAARMAARIKGDLDVIHVTSGQAGGPVERRALDRLRDLAGDLGARWEEIHDDDPVQAIIGFAREHQITQIVIGASTRHRWQQLARGGSNVARIIRAAGEIGIDVYVIARDSRA